MLVVVGATEAELDVDHSPQVEELVLEAAGVFEGSQLPQVAELVEDATGVFEGSQLPHVAELVEDATGVFELDGSQTDQVAVAVLVEAAGVLDEALGVQTAQFVASGVGTQTGEPVTTVVTALQTWSTGAA